MRTHCLLSLQTLVTAESQTGGFDRHGELPATLGCSPALCTLSRPASAARVQQPPQRAGVCGPALGGLEQGLPAAQAGVTAGPALPEAGTGGHVCPACLPFLAPEILAGRLPLPRRCLLWRKDLQALTCAVKGSSTSSGHQALSSCHTCTHSPASLLST